MNFAFCLESITQFGRRKFQPAQIGLYFILTMPTPTLPHKIAPKITRQITPHIPLAAYRRLIPRNPIGFFYHTVSDVPLPHVRHLYPYKSAAEFEQDILYLKQHFTLIGYPMLEELSKIQKQSTRLPTLPSKAAFLSFDDGFSECYTVVRSILLKHNIPCIFFLTTDWIDNQAMYYRGKMSLVIETLALLNVEKQTAALRRINAAFKLELVDLSTFSAWILRHQRSEEPLVDWVCDLLELDVKDYLNTNHPFLTRTQIAQMQSEGFVFGAHTRRHPKLSTVSQEEQTAEIVESCRIVSEITGKDQVPFAFPFSGSGVDRDFLAELRTQNPFIGPIFDTQKLRLDRPFIFHRIWADKPVPGIPPEENIAYWLHDAYVREVNRTQS